MKILQKANNIYRKYFCVIVPMVTIMFAVLEYVFGSGTPIKRTSSLVIALAAGGFAYWYISGGKRNITLFLAQIYELYYILFLFVARVTNASDFVWFIFISIGLFMLFFILTFNVKYKHR